jgi:flagellar biosynthesis GTPase FlhF
MRLKSFQAKSMSEAMRQIKETLGDDAIIVSTKEEAGGWVRVTAAVEQAAPAEAAAPAAVAAAASAAGGRRHDVPRQRPMRQTETRDSRLFLAPTFSCPKETAGS